MKLFTYCVLTSTEESQSNFQQTLHNHLLIDGSIVVYILSCMIAFNQIHETCAQVHFLAFV